MAREPKPEQPGREFTPAYRHAENWGRPLGGANFLLAGTGDGFSVPSIKGVWCGVIHLPERRTLGFRDGNAVTSL